MSKGKKAAIALLAIVALFMAASCNNGGGVLASRRHDRHV